jgi:hypothetical protein
VKRASAFLNDKKLSLTRTAIIWYTAKQIKGLSQKKRHDFGDIDGGKVL